MLKEDGYFGVELSGGEKGCFGRRQVSVRVSGPVGRGGEGVIMVVKRTVRVGRGERKNIRHTK